MDKIKLTPEQSTLLIPLYGKARESSKTRPILEDTRAKQIMEQVDFDFSTLNIPEKTNVMMCLRAKIMDDLTLKFLESHENPMVLHLGCGLDSRFERVGSPKAKWFDLDFEEVISLRRTFFEETGQYHMLGGSVTDPRWMDALPGNAAEALVIAEGLLMYLKEAQVRQLIQRLAATLGSFTLIFDAFSTLTARNVGRHPSLKKTGAQVYWGIDDPRDFEAYGHSIQFESEHFLTQMPLIQGLSPGLRLAFRISSLFLTAKRAHRILVYRVG